MNETAEAPRTSKAAVAGFVLSILGICFLPFALLALVFGGIGIAKTGKGLRGRVLAILALCFGGLGVLSGGVLAAIAIRAYIEYIREAKELEARENVNLIADGVIPFFYQERFGPDGALLPRALPAPLPRTPAVVSCTPVPWPADAHPGWAALGFSPVGPLRFGYELAVAPDGQSFVARATGDLDCDGVPESVVERGGRVTGTSLGLDPEAGDRYRSGTHPHGWDFD